MRTKDPEKMDAIRRFVNRYYRERQQAPTIDEISTGTGSPRSTVQRYLQELGEKGLLHYRRGILSPPEEAKMKSAYVSAPLLGSIPCGEPEDEEELIDEYVSLPVSMFGKGDFYVLRAAGDSMADAGIEEGDFVIIERHSAVSEGDIVVALDAENRSTLKRFSGYDVAEGCYVLSYENAARYPGKVIFVKEFTVQGVARKVLKAL